MRVAITDELHIYRCGLGSIFSREPDFSVVGLGSSPADAVALADQHTPDILIMGVDHPPAGLEFAAQIRQRTPRVRIALITSSQKQEDIAAALQLGIGAYVLRSIGEADLVQTLRMISRGETYLTPSLAVRMLLATQQPKEVGDDFSRRLQSLTEREHEILRELALARTNKEIARNLNLSEKTIKYYMGRLMQKLRARNRTEVAMRVRESTRAA